jgi:hypothetical protein
MRQKMTKIIFLFFFTLLMVTEIDLYSQEPPPPIAQGQPRKSEPKLSTSGNIETKNKNNPPKSPVPKPTLNIEKTNKSNATAKNSYKEKSDKDGSITGTGDYAFWLTLFTGLLVLCNGVLCLFNIKLWRTTTQAIELAREEFIATHRPKLRVHSICLKELDTIPDFTNGSPPITHQINCSINNIGGSSATITEISITFKRLNDPLPIPSYSEPVFIKKSIACGESIAESCDVEAFVIDCNIERSLNDLYFLGYIDYLDNIRTIRRTAFCRRYIQETKRFIKVDDEDYEYSY